mgnify:CR=1 FL=1
MPSPVSVARARNMHISRWQLDLCVSCPRCFWLLKRHNIKPPEGYPLALNMAMDTLLKAEFDIYRAKGEPHPILTEHGVPARLFPHLDRLQQWRNTLQGLRWTDPDSGHVLFGAIDDLLEYADGSVAVLDYKSSGARQAVVYPSYQLQLDVYTFLLQQLGYTTAPQAFLAFFLAVKDAGFGGRLPFRGLLVPVTPQPDRVLSLFQQAVELARAASAPMPGSSCDVCRWFGQARPALANGPSD